MKRMEAKDAAASKATTTLGPRTLRELGVPGALAADLESALRRSGHAEGGRITRYRFVTPDGASHALRLGEGRGDESRPGGDAAPEREAA
jgi:hypothetical protein